MFPLLFKVSLDTTLSAVIAYLVALAIVAYAAWSGWRGTEKAQAQAKAERALIHGAIAAVLAGFGLSYALPPAWFPGGKGEGIPLHSYGILLAGGFVSAVTLAAHMAEQEWRGEEGLRKREEIFDLAFWVFLSGVGGAKLLFIIVNWKDYGGRLGYYLSSPGKLVDCLSGGLVFYGGLIGAAIASFAFARHHKMDFLRLADLAIPTVSLGQCLGRLGCFSAGCCWGDIAPAGFRLGVHFPGAAQAKTLLGTTGDVASLAFQSQAQDSGRWVLEATGQVFHQAVPGAVRISDWALQHGHTLPVHPTQLYESVGQFVLFVALMALRRYRRFHGQIFAMWLMSYAALRSSVELFRGDLERGTLNGLLRELGMAALAAKIAPEAWYNISTSQFISLCLFVLGATILYRRWRGAAAQPGPGGAPTPA